MNKMEIRKLKLNALEGSFGCSLEIEPIENRDIVVRMTGQDTKGKVYCVSAQIPSPISGGGDLNNYKTLVKIYDAMKLNPKIKKA